MKNIAVFASGNGSNFQAIVDVFRKNTLKANIKLLVCDNPNAFVLERARRAKIKTLLLKSKDYADKKSSEEEIVRNLEAEKIDLVILAGFMRMLSGHIISRYQGKILNIHPALLPAFKGASAIKDAFDYGVKMTGVTVHFVDEKMDNGPIILQEAVKIKESDTLKKLEERIHKVEHKIYPQAIQLFISGNLRIRGRKVEVRKPR